MNAITRYLLWVACSSLLLFSCGGDAKDKKNVNSDSDPEAKALMETYCQRCHKLPSPGLLDQNTWKNHVLVRMAAFLGVFTDNVQYYDTLPSKWLEPGEGGQSVLNAGVYPKQAQISRKDWERIRDYIVKNAPAVTTGAANAAAIATDLKRFRAHPILSKDRFAAMVTGVKIDPVNGKLYAGFFKQEIVECDIKGKILSSMEYKEAPVQFITEKNRFTIVNIGNIRGYDTPIGEVRSAASFQALKSGNTILNWQKLMRPVNLNYADLDGDKDEDILLCEFGNLVGDMVWYENKNGKYERRLLYPDDGATRAIVQDLNGDGLPEITALMANADEGIDIFVNKGKGEFEKQRIERFDPSYGSTSLQLIDWDRDGDPDILYGNGDNGDYNAILKPYHGIRLFINEGNLNFTESFFYPLNGVYRATADDFDLDGDMDIAVVAFYPDYNAGGKEAFVYLENDGKNAFHPSTLPEFDFGRWMVMDAADADHDGDTDLLLGAFNVKSSEVPAAVVKKWEEADTPVMYLENLTK